MTNEDRNIKLKHLISCMKCEASGKVCDENCPTQYEAGNMGEIIENLEAISEILEQKPCEDVKEEIWKDIPEFEGIYEASNMGRIRSVSRIVRSGKGNRINPTVILKPAIGQWGYEQVCLRKDGKKYTKRVNRLVAQAFIPNPNNLPQVNHIDGDKTNNCIDNLEWCDASHNMKHCFNNQMSDWTTKIRIIETGEVFNSKAECARKIGGHMSLIDMCLKGKRKTHKGYHFEIIGERASDKYNRKNVINKKDNYESELKIEYKGEVHSFREWSMITGIKQHTLYTRYNRGDREEQLFRPIQLERGKIKMGNTLDNNLVSRQAVLDIIMPYCQDDDGSVENTGDLRNALDDIESLSPVTPKEKIIHCKDCKYRDYWGDCNKWSKELDAHKTYLLDENMFCGLAEIKDGE